MIKVHIISRSTYLRKINFGEDVVHSYPPMTYSAVDYYYTTTTTTGDRSCLAHIVFRFSIDYTGPTKFATKILLFPLVVSPIINTVDGGRRSTLDIFL